MGNIIITATTDIATLDAPVRRALTDAYSALSALEPSPARIRRAAQKVGALRAQGLSIRGIVALLSVAGKGTLPTGKGTIERLGYVADALGGEWGDVGDARDAIVMAFNRIAQTGTAADVKRAAEAGRKASYSGGGDAAYEAVAAVRDALNADTHRSLTSKPERPVAGEAADGGKRTAPADDTDTDADDTTPAQGSVPRTTGQGVALMSITTARLITELKRRAEAPGFSADDLALFDDLAQFVEEVTVSATPEPEPVKGTGKGTSTAPKRATRKSPVKA